MMPCSRSLISYLFLLLPCLRLSLAHPSHENEHRDLAKVYYGPDTTNTQFLPVPPGSNIPVDPEKGYYLEHLGHGTYFVTNGGYQTMFLVSTHGVILVDNPPTLGYGLKAAIKSVTDQPVTHFVYSHAHADHVGGAFIFNETAKYIGHVATRDILERFPDPLRPAPNVTFHDHKILKVGNQTLELSYKGEVHLDGNIFVYAPASKTLLLIDVVFPGWAPFSELAVSTNIPGWIAAHDQILDYDFTVYIGGHISRYGNRTDVIKQKEYVNDLVTNCKSAINGGFNVSAILGLIAEQNPGNTWAQFKAYLKIAAGLCAKNTNEKWVGKLAGVDVFGWENAYKVIEALRIDYDVLGPAFGVQPPTEK